MWIRTRVGLVALAEPFEIRVFKASTGARMILAQTRRTAEGTGKTWFRQLRITNPAFHLAHFADGPTVDAEVGQVMSQIYAAVQSKLDVLDLSGVGVSRGVGCFVDAGCVAKWTLSGGLTSAWS